MSIRLVDTDVKDPDTLVKVGKKAFADRIVPGSIRALSNGGFIGYKTATLHYLPAGAKQPTTLALPTGTFNALVPNDDGKRVLAYRSVDGGFEVFEVALDGGATRTLATLPSCDRIAWGPDGRLVVAVDGRVRLVDVTGPEPRAVAETDAKVNDRPAIATVHGGRVLAMTSGNFERHVYVYAIRGDALERLAAFELIHAGSFVQVDQRVLLTVEKKQYAELVGLGEAYDGHAPTVDARPDTASNLPASSAPVVQRELPFAFFGDLARETADWNEGANAGHAYELLFRTEPDRLAIARAFAAATKTGAVEPATHKPWLWSGRWALLDVGERHATRGGYHASSFFAAMVRVLEAIHAVSPLEQVVFWGVKAWGQPPTKLPIPGPPFPGRASVGRYGEPRDLALSTGAVDHAFENARVDAR